MKGGVGMDRVDLVFSFFEWIYFLSSFMMHNDHILLSETDSYVNIGRLRFIFTTKTLISSMG